MMDFTTHTLPASIGVGFKSQHFNYIDILSGAHQLGWLAIYAENYLGRGAANFTIATVAS